MNKRKNVLLLTALAVVPFALQLSACGEKFDTCENTLTCGDGDASGGTDSTGGTSGTGGEGDGDTGGSGGGTEEGCSPACTGEMVCDLASKQCVACVKSDDCKGADTYCDTDTNLCVECLETVQCTDAAASVCNAGACEQCQGPEDCAHIEDKGLCDEGTCVQCTVDDESACGVYSCDPATNACTTTERGKVKVCEPCVADSECEPNYACVPMFFQGTKLEGGYCLKDPTLGSPGCPANVFSTPTNSRVSLSGAEGKAYCGINETLATCEAYFNLIQIEPTPSCASPSDCGAPDLDDARCETVSLNPSRCTYSCELPKECPNGEPCNGPSGDKYCGGPL